ncbi:MAG: Bax inhibitor-1/YccA family protein [Microthrixaceae bacterium]
MSRNPILNENAFGGSPPLQGSSPADEWAAAQGGAAGATGATQGAWTSARQSTTGRYPTDPNPAAPPSADPYASNRYATTATDGRVMTLGGVSAATMFMFVFLLVAGAFGWTQVTEGTPVRQIDGTIVTPVQMNSPGLLIGAVIVGFILAMVTVFKPKFARFTAIPYSIAQGVMLGMISHLYNSQFNGIVIQAVLATFGVFLTMLVLYGLRILRATPKFVKGVMAATFGIMIMYLLSWVMSLVSSSFTPIWANSSAFGIIISVVIVIVAALNLILDFDFIERGSKNNLPAYMDWYAAFGLVLTLIWLYLEMLRLLSKLRQ